MDFEARSWRPDALSDQEARTGRLLVMKFGFRVGDDDDGGGGVEMAGFSEWKAMLG